MSGSGISHAACAAWAWIWGHRSTLWEITKHLWIAIALTGWITVKIGHSIAAEYQRQAKVIEVRFDLLQRAAGIYYKAVRAAGLVHRMNSQLAGSTTVPSVGTDPLARLRDAMQSLESCLGDGAALSDVVEVFFSESTAKHWNGVMDPLSLIWEHGRAETDAEAQAMIQAVSSEWGIFVEGAARESKLPPRRSAGKK